jgi:hypothetical protein
MALYHFTCAHGRRDIGTSNCLLLPHLHPWLGVKLLWLTSEASPERTAVGLTMRTQKCERMAFRYIVDDVTDCQPWLDWPRRARLRPELLHSFEHDERGGEVRPETWWVAERPIRAKFDRSWRLEIVA